MSEAPPPVQPAPLFSEPGASWYWVLLGPAAGLVILLVQNSNGDGLQLLTPGMFLVLVSGFVAVQVKAARIHSSVELTERTLRQGTETIGVDEIVMVYPEPPRPARSTENPEEWQEARALGELSGVPRRRVSIGLQLTGKRPVQAWARDHRRLRAAITSLMGRRADSLGGFDPAEFAEPDSDDDSSQW
ncbi:MAG: hypothetical protein ABI307_14850 [Mycobacterium sp.]